MTHQNFCEALPQLHHIPAQLLRRLTELSDALSDTERTALFAASKDFNQKFTVVDSATDSILERIDQHLATWERKAKRFERTKAEAQDHNGEHLPSF